MLIIIEDSLTMSAVIQINYTPDCVILCDLSHNVFYNLKKYGVVYR